ncbi:MAG: 2-oxoacid:acceptor oxidoreductase family protein, partial [candidate division WOR-3 bacterium]
YNPDEKPQEIARRSGLEFGVWRNPFGGKPVMRLTLDRNRPSLVEKEDGSKSLNFGSSALKRRTAILIAGSAGGRIQQTAEALASAAIATGLYASKKGTYPVTVGTGYSVAEVILSPQPILYTGVQIPDIAVVVSEEGLGYVRSMLSAGLLIIDESLTPPASAAEIVRQPFQKTASRKNAALLALLFLLRRTNLLPVEALIEQVKTLGRIPDEEVEKILQKLKLLLKKEEAQ